MNCVMNNIFYELMLCKVILFCYIFVILEFSKMAQTLRKYFRKEVANLLEMLETVDSSNSNSEESNDSQYHSSSNSNSSSPPHEPPVVEPKEHKKVKSKKKKRKHGNMEALDMLAQASDIAIQVCNE